MGGRDSPDIEAGPSRSRSQFFGITPHTMSSPNVLRTAHDAPRHVPPVISHETQERKEDRRQKAWGRNLYGNAHVAGIRVPAPEGGTGMWFLFTVSENSPAFSPDRWTTPDDASGSIRTARRVV